MVWRQLSTWTYAHWDVPNRITSTVVWLQLKQIDPPIAFFIRQYLNYIHTGRTIVRETLRFNYTQYVYLFSTHLTFKKCCCFLLTVQKYLSLNTPIWSISIFFFSVFININSKEVTCPLCCQLEQNNASKNVSLLTRVIFFLNSYSNLNYVDQPLPFISDRNIFINPFHFISLSTSQTG